jgi:phosphate transport system substrate-binding protein
MQGLLWMRRLMAGATLVAAITAAAGCSSPGGAISDTNASASPAASSAPDSGSAVNLNGTGATFPAPLYKQWFQEFASTGGASVNYQALGSGAGIKAITGHTVDFGASDAPMSDQELAGAPGVLHVPTVAGAVCVSYNVPGITAPLKLTGDVISGIYLGTITKWNDPKITALNPGVSLPGSGIYTVHRADGSGTTNAFTTYLSDVSPDWKAKVGSGKSVDWPGGIGGKGTPGVAALLKQTAGAIGYVELNYALANKLPSAVVRNQAGNFVAPTVESTTAAAAGVQLPADFRKVIVNTSDPKGYPISSFTYILVYPNCKPAVKSFLNWALTTGQKDAPTLGYAPLPPAVQKKALAVVDKLT